jgi:hypothetical protein
VYDSGAEPDAATVNNARWPMTAIWLTGWPEIDGATVHVTPHPQIWRITASEMNRQSSNDRCTSTILQRSLSAAVLQGNRKSGFMQLWSTQTRLMWHANRISCVWQLPVKLNPHILKQLSRGVRATAKRLFGTQDGRALR